MIKFSIKIALVPQVIDFKRTASKLIYQYTAREHHCKAESAGAPQHFDC